MCKRRTNIHLARQVYSESGPCLCLVSTNVHVDVLRMDHYADMLTRLLVYYPVSALVTLFANILQNPQDARARSDLKLMNSMTEFLQMLCSEDGNIHCRRMASIC